jgi:NAD(P)-dependent dehydrogenase (short-subunit alcohol dehydrogenase family)
MNATKKRTVVITGSSSGIGHACVARMVQSGWHVVATVRKPEDGSRLKSKFGASLSAVMMDVTDRATVTAAAEEVLSQLQGGGLDGLVNVAGVGMMRPVEYATLDDLQQIFDINVFGQIAVTQAFLPNASKSAFSRFSETLRLELHPFGVHVCEVEPGAIRTPAVEKTLGNVEAIIADLPARGAAQYGEMLKGFARRAYAREMNGSAPDVVAGAVHHALTAHRPRSRYLVGKHAKLLGTLPRILPRRLLEALLLRIAGLPTRFGAVPAADDRGVYQRAA